MLKLIVCALAIVQFTAAFSLDLEKRRETDEGDYILICQHEPIDLGIVLDSSSSIHGRDFKKGLVFLQNFLKEFTIGNTESGVRVSLITFGRGIYPDNAFNLSSYDNYEDLKNAIGRIEHKSGLFTATGLGIKYMAEVQMKEARDYAAKVAIVITDGNSQIWRETQEEARKARESGIKMFAVGVGNVREEELLRIAGDPNRIIKVTNYDDLEGITQKLANETCVRKPKPTTTPPPKTECGVAHPADINFVFSPADLGTSVTRWVTDLISRTAEQEDFQKGFRFGAVTGSCPEDEGFNLDAYQTVGELSERLSYYSRYRLPGLVTRTVEYSFTSEAGGRGDAMDVAIVVIGDQERDLIQEQVNRLLEQDIMVVIADPYQTGWQFDGAVTLEGSSTREVVEDLAFQLCGRWE